MPSSFGQEQLEEFLAPMGPGSWRRFVDLGWQEGGENLCGGRKLMGMEVGEEWLPAAPRTILTC